MGQLVHYLRPQTSAAVVEVCAQVAGGFTTAFPAKELSRKMSQLQLCLTGLADLARALEDEDSHRQIVALRTKLATATEVLQDELSKLNMLARGKGLPDDA